MDLEVVGRHALFFDDDSMAAFVNSPDALVEWNSLKIDRHDVRHLLSALPPQQRRSLPSLSQAIDSSLKSELDLERYLDLPDEQEEEKEEEKEEGADSFNTGGYHAIPFSYENTNGSAEQTGPTTGLECSEFRPSFNVPENLLQCLPPSEKVHQIIARTAQFVSRHGGQSEIVLRVKQGDNPTFGFLMPDHHLHPYFRYLVDHPGLLLLNNGGKPQNEERKDVSESDGALSLLGSVYGSGEDEDDSNKLASDEVDAAVASHAKEKGDSSAIAPKQDEIISEDLLPCGGSDKEKTHLPKKNTLTSGLKNGSTSRKKTKDDISASIAAALEKIKASGLGTIKTEPVVVEPPSDLKQLIGKIVEFIVKNGKQFEATLVEQDSKHGRFPFLLPSNMYHPYYLKVLNDAQESKVSGKTFSSSNGVSIGQGLEKKASISKEGGEADLPCESDKKEKFKMVIGKSKKDQLEQSDKVTQQEHEFSLDAAAAAAILQAAARGIKNPDLGFLSKAAMNAPPEADSSETQASKEHKLKAERLKKAKMFVAMLKNGAAPFKRDSSRGLSSEPQESGVSGSGEQREGSTAPLDGGRLKVGDENNEKRSMRKYRSRSAVDEDDGGERKQQSTDKSSMDDDKGDDSEVDKDYKRSDRKKHHHSHHSDEDEERGHRHRHSKKKHHRSHHSDEDEEKGHRHRQSRKKHRSHHSSHKHDDDDDDDERDEEDHHRHSRKKHKSHHSHHSSRHRSRHERRKRESSDDEQHKHKSSNKHRKRDDLEEGEISGKVSDQSRGSLGREASLDISSSQQKASSQTPESSAQPSDDLRAKIRAMLMETRR